jgi:hypothetical protein
MGLSLDFLVYAMPQNFLEKYVAKCMTILYSKHNRGVYMKFVSVRDFRASSANIWKTLPEEQEMVIANNGKPIALLTPIER